MDKFQMVVTFVTSLVVLLGALSGFIISFVKAVKDKKIVMNKLNILDVLSRVVEDAKNLDDKNDDDKVQYLIAEVDKYAKENNLEFEADEVNKAIKGIVDFFYSLTPPKK